MSDNEETLFLDDDIVLIAGGGPVGLMVGTVLAHYGAKSIILERNESTTKWPKMDLTNVRSMELLRRLGMAEEVRKIGIPSTTPYNVYMTAGLHNDKPITSWEYLCVDELKTQYRQRNDGSSPLEPWQRISQEVFEKFLKSRCDDNHLIDCRFGWQVKKTTESNDGVLVEATQQSTNKTSKFFAKYLVACDGASSRVRRDMEIPIDGGPIPGYALLVHFKSRDLRKLFKYGRFWHYFVYNETGLHAAAICQDDEDTFTTHLLLPLDADHASIDSYDAVYRALGGMGGPFPIEIDEILVRSIYRHSVALARSYRSPLGRVFLAGDSAHQNIPTGGYGMNVGIGDAFDIGWKLAAVHLRKAGKGLLSSYELERRPIAMMCAQRSGTHMEAHMAMSEFLKKDPHLVEQDSPEGQALRDRIHEHYQTHSGENADWGIEMDHRHKSNIYPPTVGSVGEEPHWDPAYYTPNTFIGSRAPHVFLKDGSSIFDRYGPHWTLIQFHREGSNQTSPISLLHAAQSIDMPLTYVLLDGEDTAEMVWQVPLVLIRPDGHVAWRGHVGPSATEAIKIVNTVTGRSEDASNLKLDSGQISEVFAATSAMDTQVRDYKLDKMGAMQM